MHVYLPGTNQLDRGDTNTAIVTVEGGDEAAMLETALRVFFNLKHNAEALGLSEQQLFVLSESAIEDPEFERSCVQAQSIAAAMFLVYTDELPDLPRGTVM